MLTHISQKTPLCLPKDSWIKRIKAGDKGRKRENATSRLRKHRSIATKTVFEELQHYWSLIGDFDNATID